MELRRRFRVRSIILLATALQLITAAFGVAILLGSAPTDAAQTVPYLINFQGRLTDNNGDILSDGSYNVKFRLFDAATSGTNQWEGDRVRGTSDHRITVQNGLFNIQFGDTSQGDPALSPTLFSTGTRLYLEVELPTPATATCATNGCAVFTEGAMTPRQPLSSSPYAFNSDTLDGLDSTAFAQLTAANTFTGANLFAPTAGSTAALTVKASTAGGSDALDIYDSSGARQAYFDSSGTLNVAQTIQPTSNGGVGLGTTGNAFGTLYAQNLDTGTSGTTLSIGAANATTVNLATDTTAQTVNIGNSTTGSITTLQGGGVSATLTGGGIVVQPATDNPNVFEVVNAAGSPMFNVDTTDTNLITGLDPGFEANPINSWAIKGAGSTITRTTAQHYTGNAAGLMTTPTSANNGIQLPYTFTNGQPYDFSFYAMLGSGTMTTLVVGHQDTAGTNVNCLTAQTVVTTGWTRYTCSFTAGAPSGSNLYIYDSSATGHTLYVDGFQLLPGAAAGVYGGGNLQLNSTITSPLAIQNPTNSTTEFSVANAAGATILNVDTLNGKINLGTSAAITTGGALSGLTGTSQSSGTALFKTSSSVNAFQVQNASGWQLMDIDSTFPAANLITNPGFETNTTGWANKAGGALTRITTPTTALYYGVAAGNLALTATNGGASFAKALTLGTTYNLSFYARASTGTANNISFGYTNTGGDQDCATSQTLVNTGFTRYSCSFTVTTTAGTAIYVKQSTAVTQTIYIDGFQLLSGATAATPYSLGNIALRGVITSPVSFVNTNDSTTAFQIQNATGTSNLLVADTLDGRIGIGTANPQALLDVAGTVNATAYSVGGSAGASSTVSCTSNQAVTTATFSNGILTAAPGCSAITGTGADTGLDNLTTTAINQSLVADTDNFRDLGSAAKIWKNVFTGNVDAGTTTTALTIGTSNASSIQIGKSGVTATFSGPVSSGSNAITTTGALNGGTAVLGTSVTSPSYTGTGAVSLTSGGSAALTLDSLSGNLALGTSTTAIQKAAGALAIDLATAGTSTLTVKNSNGANVANLSVTGGVTIGSGQVYNVGATPGVASTVSCGANQAVTTATFTGGILTTAPSCSAITGTGATTTLNNVGSTSIGAALIPSANNTQNIGSTGNVWQNVFAGNIDAGTTTTALTIGTAGTTTGVTIGRSTVAVSIPGGVSTSGGNLTLGAGTITTSGAIGGGAITGTSLATSSNGTINSGSGTISSTGNISAGTLQIGAASINTGGATPTLSDVDYLDSNQTISGTKTLSGTTTFSKASNPGAIFSGTAASGGAQLQFGNVAALSSGSVNGTYIGSNPAAYTGDFVNLQINNAVKLKVDNTGNATLSGGLTIGSGTVVTVGAAAGQTSTVSCGANQAVTTATFTGGILTTAPGCAAIAGTGATTTLNNVGSTSIGAALISSANNTQNLGSAANVWQNVFTGNLDAGTTTTALTVGTAGTTTAVTIGRSGVAVSIPGGITTSGGNLNLGSGTITTSGTIGGGAITGTSLATSGNGTINSGSGTISTTGAVTSGTHTLSSNGAAGAPVLNFTGSPLGGTAAAATTSLVQFGPAISGGNQAANGGTYLGLNLPVSGAGAAADFLNFQKNNVVEFKVDNAGNGTLGGGLTVGTGSVAAFSTAGFLQNAAVDSTVTYSNLQKVGTISTGTWQGTAVGVLFGGTGQTTYTDGQLLIGNTTGNTLTKATLTGTANRLSITNGSGSITLNVDATQFPNSSVSGTILKSTGANAASWVANTQANICSDCAVTTLNNVGSTSIGAALVASTNNAQNLGSAGNVWQNVFTGNVDAGTTTTALTVGTATTTTAVTIGRSGVAVSLPGGLTTSGGAINTGTGAITSTGTISGGTFTGTNGNFTNVTNALTLGTTNTAQFNVTGTGAQTFSFATGGTVCTTSTSTCGSAYQAAGSYLVQAPAGTANTVTAASGAQAFVIKGTNGTGTHLLDIYNTAASPVLTSFFDQNGALTTGAAITGTGSPSITGFGAISASTFSGSGASLTNLPAGNLTGSYAALNGSAITSLDPTHLIQGSGAVSLQSAAATGLTVDSGTTGQISIGTDTVNSKTIQIGAASTNTTTTTLNVGTNTAGTQDINIGSTGSGNAAAGTTISIQGGTAANTAVTIGTNGAGGVTLDTGTTGQINIGSGTSNAKTIQIGPSATNASTTTYNLGTNTAGTQDINIGSTGSGNAAAGTTVDIQGGTTAGTAVTIGTNGAGGITVASGASGSVNINAGTTGLNANFAAGVTATFTATAAMTADQFDQTNTSATDAPTADGVNLLQQTFFAKPSGTNMESSTRINVTNSNTATGGQVQALRIVAAGAGGAIASDTDGILIDPFTNASSGTGNENALEIGSGWDAGFLISSGGNTISATSATALKIQNAGSVAELTVDASANVVHVGSATSDATQILFQLDSFSTLLDTAACSATTNQGALYYNTNTSSIRSCVNAGWEDIVTTAGLGILAYGVVADTGAVPGDIANKSSTTVGAGPCKVGRASATSVTVTACSVYSSGRKSAVAAATLTGVVDTNGTWTHVCINPTTGQPALDNNAITETGGFSGNYAFSAASPVVCLADIVGTGANISIYDTRVFTNTQKSFVFAASAMPLGSIAKDNGAAAASTITLPGTTAGTGFLKGVIVATSGAAWAAGGPNAVIAYGGPVYVKSATGTLTASDTVQNSTTNGYATIAAAPAPAAANTYAQLGIAETARITTCSNGANCNFSILVDLNIR